MGKINKLPHIKQLASSRNVGRQFDLRSSKDLNTSKSSGFDSVSIRSSSKKTLVMKHKPKIAQTPS